MYSTHKKWNKGKKNTYLEWCTDTGNVFLLDYAYLMASDITLEQKELTSANSERVKESCLVWVH